MEQMKWSPTEELIPMEEGLDINDFEGQGNVEFQSTVNFIMLVQFIWGSSACREKLVVPMSM